MTSADLTSAGVPVTQEAARVTEASPPSHLEDATRRIVQEQAALLRVAGLVARGASDAELFDLVTIEATRLIDGEGTTLVRFDGARSFVIVATCGGPAPIGLRVEVPPQDDGTISELLRTRRSARRDDYNTPFGRLYLGGEAGPGSSVSVPIVVADQLWGALGARVEGRRLPSDTEERLEKFAELISAAIGNSQARGEVQRLADEQTALRRVAELVARGASESELFDVVAVQAASLVQNEPTTLVRYEGERVFTVLATCGGPVAPGASFTIPHGDLGTLDQLLRDPSRPSRLDDYESQAKPLFTYERYGVNSSVAVPIIVDEQLWGAIGTLTDGQRLPAETEARLQQFAELIAAALANSQARAQIRQLADEQTALRRVAELVARSAPLQEVFEAIAIEASTLVGSFAGTLTRFDQDGFATVVAVCNSPIQLGTRLQSHGDSVIGHVLRTEQPFRVLGVVDGERQRLEAELGVVAAVGVPIVVEGRVWGCLLASTSGPALPTGTEARLGEFAALAAAAIANAENKAELKASRARVVATADDTRRRVQRDVHDGAQQRLLQTVITLKLARDAVASTDASAPLISEALYHAERANQELRDLVHGILPASLSHSGLRAGLESLIDDLPIRVSLSFDAPRFAADTETTGYFVVAEALANVVKHADASHVDVHVSGDVNVLTIEISDDGVGGADASLGSGLTGLADRVGAAEGTLNVTSPVGRGTTLRATLPNANK